MINNKLSLRDYLAIDRTRLANQRTFLAYCRTSIMLFVAGISVVKLFSDNKIAYISGIMLILVSVLTFLLGVYIYLKEKNTLGGYFK